jgi:DNA-binding GntR family transcriptional regulator
VSEMSQDWSVARPRLSDVAYDRIRRAIITGELEPGSKIKDSELADRLGLSRTPVREALARLADTGLVEAKPGVHTLVTTLNRADVEATLDVVEVLDHLAVRSAVPNLTAADLTALRKANDQFAAEVRKNDIGAALAADDAFHSVIIDAARNPLLKRLISQSEASLHRIYHRKFSTLLGGTDTVDHHNALVTLCAAGDAAGAARLAADHRRQLGGLIAELFDADEFETPPRRLSGNA